MRPFLLKGLLSGSGTMREASRLHYAPHAHSGSMRRDSGGGDKQLAQLMQLVANLRRLFELEVLGVLHHLPFQLVDLLLQRFWRHLHGAKPGRLNGLRFTAPFGFSFRQALAQRAGYPPLSC